ncbi:sperm acrosome membrane-associated protein 4-like [Phycodurus eques]|uniref:sperm acrosome membrane-associated protein 4-like n=1 Tax=Phycodurus eques TaxID=693459 RepID=UPI002ACDEF53|nr:sperm acrosome membrane-associated protein 4-like [Phycodurus eques]
MSQLFGALLFLLVMSPSVPLFCYTCVFPTISPLDCINFPLICPAGQVCLTSRAVGQKGEFCVVLYERSCIQPVLCGVTGQRSIMGLNFTFTNECCNTHLCNGATATSNTVAEESQN